MAWLHPRRCPEESRRLRIHLKMLVVQRRSSGEAFIVPSLPFIPRYSKIGSKVGRATQQSVEITSSDEKLEGIRNFFGHVPGLADDPQVVGLLLGARAGAYGNSPSGVSPFLHLFHKGRVGLCVRHSLGCLHQLEAAAATFVMSPVAVLKAFLRQTVSLSTC